MGLVLYFTQELPEQWNNVKKQAMLEKQNVAPLQANEVSIIRRKLATFDVGSCLLCCFLCCCFATVSVPIVFFSVSTNSYGF